jgi:hypothetical protein
MNRREATKNTALLFGLTVSGGAISSLFSSCQKQNRLDWKPVFFTEDEALNISALCETILPKTDTPGARELKVDIFVDLMMKETLSPEDQQHVKKGYGRFVELTAEMFDKDFHKLLVEEQKEVLKALSKETNKFVMSVWGSPIGEQPPLDFYRRIKQFSMIGYFTSERIGKDVLAYDPIPGGQKGCIPFDEVGRSWSL